MKLIKLGITVLFLTSYFVFQVSSERADAQTKSISATDVKVAEARKIADGLFQKVKGLLIAKMNDGNYAEAAEVCSNVAQKMTKDYAEETGIDVHRVSLKYRNPLNRPDKFEKKRLKIFEREIAENKTVSEYYEVIEKGDERILRYMKPVIIQEMCLKCHGDNSQIPDAVKKILFAKYPKDKATGYKIGDVRGAISVRMQ